MKPAARRPALCYSAARGWLNDPNGLVFYEGEYHLFYQHNPFGAKWGPMHWGHAVSADLVAWRELGIALEPDEDGAIFSGSAVADCGDDSGLFGGGEGLVAFYTAFRRIGGTEAHVQEQCLAFSRDRGRSWAKYEGNPIIENPGIADFRDPKVFRHEPTGRWVMVVSGGDRALFYGSGNLVDWSPLSDFPSEGYSPRSCVWECPDLMRFPGARAGRGADDLWLLKVSATEGNPAGGSGEMVIPGRFDGMRFEASESGRFDWLDAGQDCYASQSWHFPAMGGKAPADRVVVASWMSNIAYANEMPAGEDWRGILSIPRELSMERRGDSYALVQRPARELARYAQAPRTLFEGESAGREEAPLPAGPMEIRLEAGGLSAFILEFASEDGDLLTVRCDDSAAGKELVLDRSAVGRTFHSAVSAIQRIALPAPGLRDLAILCDGCVWQMFLNGGEKVSSNLVFPESDFSRVSIDPLGSAGRVRLAAIPYFRT